MQKIKSFLTNYFSFGKKDRVGLICLVGLVVVIYALPYLFAKKQNPFPAHQTAILAKAVDSLAINGKKEKRNSVESESDFSYQPTQSKSFTTGELFEFDPNTISVEGWQKLGLSEKTARTIEKYRGKGGKFYKPEDIQKIWGIPEGFYERVKNYVSITSIQPNYHREEFNSSTPKFEKKVLLVNVNEADSSAFGALPGIGSKLASRIIHFRERLGGFYSVEQLGETYGLPDSTFQKIKTALQITGAVKKINVNTATKEELKTHPYIRWNLASAIVEYRNQHGPFKTLEDLKNIALLDETGFNKLRPYLTY